MKTELSLYQRSLKFSALSALIISCIILTDIRIPVIDDLELKSRDIRFLVRGEQPTSGNVVIAAIDEKSIGRIGRYPWPRYVPAEIIRILTASGARVICIDLLFTEPEENPEFMRIRKLMSAYSQLGLLTEDPSHQAFFDELADASEAVDNDGYLAGMIRDADNVILSMILGSAENDPDGNRTAPLNPDRIGAAMYPIDRLHQSAAGVGFVNIIHDTDGSVRQAFPALIYNNQLIESLPVKAVRRFLQLDDKDIRLETGVGFHMGDRMIPLNRHNQFYINYYGDVRLIPHVSVSDILTGEFPEGLFRDKCVFIGGAATGLGDHWANPFSGSFWGVELHATVADNILSGRFAKRTDRIRYADICLIGVFWLLMTFLSVRLPIEKSIIVPFFGLSVCFLIVQIMFQISGIILLFVLPSMQIVITCSGIFLWRYVGEEREKRFIKGAFQQYIHPAVVDRIIEHPERLRLGGDMKELTVMFSDIRDFTNISEKMSPQELVRFVNRYFTMMTDIIQSNYGTVDKYIGDAVMAIFGAPEDQKDHALRACQTALMMTEALHADRMQWIEEKLPEIRIGIGINTGEMIVGNMGSEKRFSYTVMGDHVNQASRLESISKLYGVKIVVSESVWNITKNIMIFRELDFIRVKGKRTPVKIFELFGKDYYSGGKYEFIQTFEAGLNEYRKQNWDDAIRRFEETLFIKSGDQPSEIFKKRCETMKIHPPDRDWDCIYNVLSK